MSGGDWLTIISLVLLAATTGYFVWRIMAALDRQNHVLERVVWELRKAREQREDERHGRRNVVEIGDLGRITDVEMAEKVRRAARFGRLQ